MPTGKARPYSLDHRGDAGKREYWACLALRDCPGLGLRRVSGLMRHFGSAYAAVLAVNDWPDAGVPASFTALFKREEWRRTAIAEWAVVKKSPCGVALWTDPEYPSLLKTIADAPPFLYFLGDVSLLNNLGAAVVGMRDCTDEGLAATAFIARGLSMAGVTVVSGMARGIDRAAHIAALEGPGGSVGVLGAGIDVEYPKGNRDLYALMRARGVLVSEHPPGFAVDGRRFPVRNRVISGLSRAVVVVEAAVRSGSLNTAGHALEQNRELMAVPGAVTAATAKGCQELVRRGAKPVFQADDVLQELVPLLEEHLRKELAGRDIARFRRRPDAPGQSSQPGQSGPPGPPGSPGQSGQENTASPVPLWEGLLPWRAPGGKKKSHTISGRNGPRAENPVPENQTRTTHAGTMPPDAAALGLSGLEAAVYDLVRTGPIHLDDICGTLGQTAGAISGVAAVLEIRGLAVRLPGMVYTVNEI